MKKMKRFVCPICGAGGASSYTPSCHVCLYKVYMMEANNNTIIIGCNEKPPHYKKED